MKRKILIVTVILVLSFSFFSTNFSTNKVYAQQFDLTAKNVFVCDSDSQTVIYSKKGVAIGKSCVIIAIVMMIEG